MGKVIIESEYVRVATNRNGDGEQGFDLAVDHYRPNKPGKFPTVLIMSRYWRSFRLRFFPQPPNSAPIGPRDPIADAILARDFAVAIVDARGTGASEGRWEMVLSPDEILDYRDVVDWLVKQPWSNGKVGATGISYEGSTAALLAATGHPAVCAVAPRSFELDLLGDIVAVGGVRNQAFLEAWSMNLVMLDQNRPPPMFGFTGRLMVSGVKRVDSDASGTRLARTIRDRNADPPQSVVEALEGVKYRGDLYGRSGIALEEASPMARVEAYRRHKVPMQLWGSWLDGTTARSMLKMFQLLSKDLLCEVRIGAFNHEGKLDASMGGRGKTAKPPLKDQWGTMIDFIEEQVAGREGRSSAVHYFVMNQDLWRSVDSWPPADSRTVALRLDQGGELGWAGVGAPTARVLEWDANRLCTTGKRNRWYTQMALPVKYNDRAKQGQHMGAVLYTKPSPEDLEITGVVEVDMWLTVSSPEVAIFVYLELCDGKRVDYVTEGIARIGYVNDQGYVSYEKPQTLAHSGSGEGNGAMKKHVIVEMLPTSVFVPKGSTLRLGFSSSDSDSFDFVEGHTKLHVGGSEHFEVSLPVRDPST